MLKKFRELTVAAKLTLAFAAVIIMFLGSFIYANVSQAEINRLHLYRHDHLGARSESLLEFHQQFTELRRLLGETYLSETWLETGDPILWEQVSLEISGIEANLSRWRDRYAELVLGDPFLSASEENIRLVTMRYIYAYVDMILDIFDDEFHRRFFVRGDMASLRAFAASTSLLTVPVENSLRALRALNYDANREFLAYIDASVSRTNSMAMAFEITGIAMSVLFALLMIRSVRKMAIEKTLEAEERVQLMLDAAPMAVFLYDENLKAIDCNTKAVETFGFSGKKEASDRYVRTLPPTQPGGEESKKALDNLVARAFSEGTVTAEFMLQKSDGTPIPAEMTHVRVRYKDSYAVAEYTRDLREVKAAEELNEKLINALPMFVEFWDADKNFVDCNQSTVDMLGLSGKDEYFKRYYDYQPEFQPCGTPSKEKIPAFLEKTLREGHARSEWMLLKTDGEPMPVEAIFARLDVSGKTMVVCFNLDLREVKAAMEREREASELNEIFMQNAPLVMNIWDDAANLAATSPHALRMFELKSAEQYIERFFDLSPEYQPCGVSSREMSLMYNKQAFEKGFVRFEWMHQKLNGEPIPTEVITQRFTRQGRSFLAAFVIDLRPAIAMQDKEVNERMRLMLDKAPLMVEYWNRDFKSIDCNKATLEFYGLSTREEYIEYLRKAETESPVEGYDGGDHRGRWAENLKKIFDTGYGRFEWAEPNNDGDFITLEIEGNRMVYNNEPVVVVYSRDVTELRKLQKEERRAEIAEESSRAKTMFLANMSHEIRTPMNSILGYSELALDDTIPDTTREHLGKIVTNTKWLLSVINDVLDISKIESGNLELEQIPFDVSSVMGYCESLLSANAESKGLTMKFDAELREIEGRRLLGDPTKLSQVCINLLSNAVKFTDEGLVSFSAAIAGVSAQSAALRFEIRDTGIGMAEEQISRVFEPFVQADSSTTRKHGGTGLGLPISKRLIEAMGGELAVESTPGLGSVFSFTLTFPTEDTGARGNNINSGPEIEKPNFTKGDVLVVDDNNMNLGVVCEHLKRVGLKSFIAVNGLEAVEAVKERMADGEAMFDLIFMDIHMPEMDGKEAALAIGDLSAGVPIVAMTAEAMAPADEAPYRDFGMEGYLGKPFTAQELWKCLLKFIRPAEQ